MYSAELLHILAHLWKIVTSHRRRLMFAQAVRVSQHL